jgi:hypothetical protein
MEIAAYFAREQSVELPHIRNILVILSRADGEGPLTSSQITRAAEIWGFDVMLDPSLRSG